MSYRYGLIILSDAWSFKVKIASAHPLCTLGCKKRQVILEIHLLRQGDELASGLEVLPLKGSSGGESPAGAALSLVLHWSYVSLLSPVNAVWKDNVAWGKEINGRASSVLTTVTVHDGNKFFGVLQWKGA